MPIAGNIYGVQAAPPATTVATAAFFLYSRSFGGDLGIGAFTAEGVYIAGVGTTSLRKVIGCSIYPEAEDGLGTRIGMEVTEGVTSDRLVTLDLYGTEAEYVYTAPSGWLVSSPQKVGETLY